MINNRQIQKQRKTEETQIKHKQLKFNENLKDDTGNKIIKSTTKCHINT